MRQTLFHIPVQIGETKLFGFGPILAVWALIALALFAWSVYKRGWNAETWNLLFTLGLAPGAAIAWIIPRLVGDEGLPVRGFGVMLLAGVVAGLGLSLRRARQMRVDPEIVMALATWMFLAGIAGARAYYVVQKWDEFRRSAGPTFKEQLFHVLNVTNGGLVVYGSMIGAGAALLLFCRRHRLPSLAMLDLIAPSLVVGLALGRIGCLMNGCCFGGLCELPWAMTFPFGSPPYARQAELGQLDDLHGIVLSGGGERDPAIIKEVRPGSPAAEHGLRAGQRIVKINEFPIHDHEEARAMLLAAREPGKRLTIVSDGGSYRDHVWTVPDDLPRSLPVHPTQIYSALDAAILALFLWAYYPFRRREGETTAWMITIYPITRFLIESIRTDEPKSILGMTTAQVLSLALLCIAIALWAYLRRQPRGTIFGQRDFLWDAP